MIAYRLIVFAPAVALAALGCAADRITAPPPTAEPSRVVRICIDSGCPRRSSHQPCPDLPPLFIVDGVPRPELTAGSHVDPGLRPGDIDHIEILKDAAAVQRYGPAGRNGVVLIRTKTAAGTTPQPVRP